MLEFFSKLFSADFMPHGHCYFWRPEILWTHVGSDIVIALAYYSIPLALLILIRKRKDITFNWIFVCFAAFIFLCGTTHLVSILTVWHGTYRLEGLIKVLTAIVSALTAGILWPLLPRILTLPSLSELEAELALRKQSEGIILETNFELEARIAERTRELEETTEDLQRYRTHLEELVLLRTRELMESQSQLRRAERLSSLGVFAAGLAHEINNPIGAMMLVAQNSLNVAESNDSDETRLRQTLTEMCKKILAHANRCGSIVRGIRQFSRGHISEKNPHSLQKLITSAIELTESTLETKGIAIECDFDSTDPHILADHVEIEQVLVNVIRNALEASEGGVEIKIRTMRNDESVTLEIEDNGPGMSDEVSERVFDPFFTTRQSAGGTGLGLSISHGIVTDHGGSIEMLSKVGKGTTVRLNFPVVSAV